MSGVDAIKGAGGVAPVASSHIPAERIPEQSELVQAVRALNMVEYYGAGNELTLIVDREKHRRTTRIVKRATGEVIRQIAPEAVLEAAQELESGEDSKD